MKRGPKKPTKQKLEEMRAYWLAHPTTSAWALRNIFNVGKSTVYKLEKTIWTENNPKPANVNACKHAGKREILRELLKKRPTATTAELARELGTSLEWVRINSPKGFFSQNLRSKRRRESETTQKGAIRRYGLRIIRSPR